MRLESYFNSSQQNEDVLKVAEEELGKDTVKSQTEVEDHAGFLQVLEFDSHKSGNINTAESNTMEVKHYESATRPDKTKHMLQVPELVICYKENSYFDVKDIGVDDNMETESKVENVAEDVPINLALSKDNELEREPSSEDTDDENAQTPGLKELGIEAIKIGPAPTPVNEESAKTSHAEESNNGISTDHIEENSAIPSGESNHAIPRSEPSNGRHENQVMDQNIPKVNDSWAGSFRDHGEASFSMSGPVSGLITYSGPIAYSGSLSLRSESSTTSTRSFAFPILQSDWHSSPVRMVKARKHRGWRQGILCCRF